MPKRKRNLSRDERRAIRDRLNLFRERHYPNREAMNRDAGVPHATASGWFHTDPAAPDTVSLVRIAARKNLNLNWLLLGEGPELRGIDTNANVWDQLRQTLVAELVNQGATRVEAEEMIPGSRNLFHFMMVEMLELWTELKDQRRSPSSRRGIARALDRSRAGLDPTPISRNLRRRLDGRLSRNNAGS
jgi:hypothetical protein